MWNSIKSYYQKFISTIYNFRTSNAELTTVTWIDHLIAGLSIFALISGIIYGANFGWAYDGIIGTLIFAPVIGLIGFILFIFLGIQISSMAYIGIWLVVFFGLILIILIIGDGFSLIWEYTVTILGG